MRYLALIILCLALLSSVLLAGETINVAAAVGLKEAMIDMGAAFQEETGDEVVFSFAASGELVKQIQQGAALDAFIASSAAEADALEKDKLTVADSRRVICGNKLVLVVPAKSKLTVKSLADLAGDEVAKIAIGDPKVEPAGVHAMEWLQHVKVDQSLAAKLVHGPHVRQLLDQVEKGQVDAAFVYQTDAEQAGLRVKKLLDAPPESHEPILYPGVILAKSTKQKVAATFLDFTKTRRGRWILQKRRGFVLDPPTTRPTTAPSTQPATQPAG